MIVNCVDLSKKCPTKLHLWVWFKGGFAGACCMWQEQIAFLSGIKGKWSRKVPFCLFWGDPVFIFMLKVFFLASSMNTLVFLVHPFQPSILDPMAFWHEFAQDTTETSGSSIGCFRSPVFRQTFCIVSHLTI